MKPSDKTTALTVRSLLIALLGAALYSGGHILVQVSVGGQGTGKIEMNWTPAEAPAK